MRTVIALAGIVGLLALGGCQSGARAGSELVGWVGLSERPLVYAVATDRPEALPAKALLEFVPLTPYDALNQALSRRLGRPVVSELCFAFQVAPNLELGVNQCALVSASQYLRLSRRERYPLLAVGYAGAASQGKRAVLVTRAGESVSADSLARAELAFGEKGNARTHIAAAAWIAAHGGSPQAARHVSEPDRLAARVRAGEFVGGFLEEAVWDTWIRTQSDAAEGLREAARTVALPERLMIASPQLDQPQRAALTESLIGGRGLGWARALSPLGLARFVAPSDDLAGTLAELARFADGGE